MHLQTHLRIWRVLRQHQQTGVILGRVCLPLVLAAVFFGSGLGSGIPGVFAQSSCANTVSVVNNVSTKAATCASVQAVSNSSTPKPVKGKKNPFPYGSCTWWAAQRFHQLTGIYVPWTTQSNAWQWTARAHQFYWHVSTRPSHGAIIDLQPWVQGAYGAGHVAVVEKVLKNGHVIASNMSWGAYPWRVVDVEFAPGHGATFITF